MCWGGAWDFSLLHTQLQVPSVTKGCHWEWTSKAQTETLGNALYNRKTSLCVGQITGRRGGVTVVRSCLCTFEFSLWLPNIQMNIFVYLNPDTEGTASCHVYTNILTPCPPLRNPCASLSNPLRPDSPLREWLWAILTSPSMGLSALPVLWHLLIPDVI